MNALRGRGIYDGSRRVVLFDLAGDSCKGGAQTSLSPLLAGGKVALEAKE